MIRSEEHLVVGAEIVPVARVRLRKYLVTEQQTFTVPVTRKEIELDYDEVPAAEQVPDGTGPLSADIVEIVRYEERVVVTKQVVAVERVRLVRHVATADQVVTGQVRREQIDVDHVETPDTPTRHPARAEAP
jgi:uncharacterized protein (TIGR02271 family)